MTSLVSTNYFSSNVKTIDSREVAEMIDVRHTNLIRTIENYIDAISANSKLSLLNYFNNRVENF